MNIQEYEDEKVYILTLDAATHGRLAVLYYRDLDIKDYFTRLLKWHEDCSWQHTRKRMMSGYDTLEHLLFIRLHMLHMDQDQVIRSSKELWSGCCHVCWMGRKFRWIL